MSKRSFLMVLFLTFFTGAIFAAWPQADIAVSSYFFTNGFTLSHDAAARMIRRVLFYLPAVVLAGMALAWLAGRFGAGGKLAERFAGFAPSTRGLVFAASAMALGPGLLVNVVLKDHWDRPRPVHVRQFNGPDQFRPWWRTDGACKKNCSFVSGEVAAATWLTAPAMLTPPHVRAAAYVAVIMIGSVTAAGRLAFGGHFLSDVLFAALLSLMICQLLFRAFFGWRDSSRRQR